MNLSYVGSHDDERCQKTELSKENNYDGALSMTMCMRLLTFLYFSNILKKKRF